MSSDSTADPLPPPSAHVSVVELISETPPAEPNADDDAATDNTQPTNGDNADDDDERAPTTDELAGRGSEYVLAPTSPSDAVAANDRRFTNTSPPLPPNRSPLAEYDPNYVQPAEESYEPATSTFDDTATRRSTRNSITRSGAASNEPAIRGSERNSANNAPLAEYDPNYVPPPESYESSPQPPIAAAITGRSTRNSAAPSGEYDAANSIQPESYESPPPIAAALTGRSTGNSAAPLDEDDAAANSIQPESYESARSTRNSGRRSAADSNEPAEARRDTQSPSFFRRPLGIFIVACLVALCLAVALVLAYHWLFSGAAARSIGTFSAVSTILMTYFNPGWITSWDDMMSHTKGKSHLPNTTLSDLHQLANLLEKSSYALIFANTVASIALLIGVIKRNTRLPLVWLIINAFYLSLSFLWFVGCVVVAAVDLSPIVRNSRKLSKDEKKEILDVLMTIRLLYLMLSIAAAIILIVKLWFMAVVVAARSDMKSKKLIAQERFLGRIVYSQSYVMRQRAAEAAMQAAASAQSKMSGGGGGGGGGVINRAFLIEEPHHRGRRGTLGRVDELTVA